MVVGSRPHIEFTQLSDLDSDFEKTFIQCIVYNYDVLKEYGDEAKTRAAGKVMTKGKDYEVADGDIILSQYIHTIL